MAKVILIGNYKGGVGKTVSTAVIGAVLARNAKVLLIDLDPQSSLSEISVKNNSMSTLSDLEFYKGVKIKSFLNNCYLKYIQSIKLDVQEVIDLEVKPYNIYKGENNSLDVLLNSLFFVIDGKEYPLDDLCMIMGNDERYLFVLYKIFKDNDLYNQYDYILIDTPPNSNIITQSAFLLSEYLIIPTIMDDVSVDGVLHYKSKISKIYNYYFNKENNCLYRNFFVENINYLGIFETMRKGNAVDKPQKAISSLRAEMMKCDEKYRMPIFDTMIKDVESVVDNCKNLKRIIENSSLNVGEGEGREDERRGYNNLCEEIINRLIAESREI